MARFLEQVKAELRVGAGGEQPLGLLLPAVQAADTAALLYNYDTVGDVTRTAVQGDAAARRLGRWLRAAERAAEHGDVERESRFAQAYLHLLGKQVNRSVTHRDAQALRLLLLGTLSETPARARR